LFYNYSYIKSQVLRGVCFTVGMVNTKLQPYPDLFLRMVPVYIIYMACLLSALYSALTYGCQKFVTTYWLRNEAEVLTEETTVNLKRIIIVCLHKVKC